MRITVIGGGAAGCFCAIEIKRRLPEAEVTVLEAGRRPMTKLALTGGGRCNLTNTFEGIQRLSEAYPRGEQLMKRALAAFSPEETLRWFEREGVRFTVQDDGCVFPASQDAMQIVRTLQTAMRSAGVKLLTGQRVASIEKHPEGYGISVSDSSRPGFHCDRVVVTTGGSPAPSGLSFLGPLGLRTVQPVPSLFSFNISDTALKALSGTVVRGAMVAIAGTRFKATGALLLTDWGISGPAVLKLSSYAARHLAGCDYTAPIRISWLGDGNPNLARKLLESMGTASPRKQLTSTVPEGLSSRLWKHLVSKAGLRNDLTWSEMGTKGLARLSETLSGYSCTMTGRCRFKDEFVTCGGVALDEIFLNSLESKKHPGLHFAGEVLDVDAITGGFNLQAAWSTAYCAACAVCGGDGSSC